MFAGEARQAGTDIVGHLVHTGGPILTLGILALREARRAQSLLSLSTVQCPARKYLKNQTLSPFLVDVDFTISAFVARLTVAPVVTHQVLTLASVDAGIWIGKRKFSYTFRIVHDKYYQDHIR